MRAAARRVPAARPGQLPTSGIANIAAARGIELQSVESRVEGDMDLQGILGLSKDVRNGYDKLRVTFDVTGKATPEELRQIVEQSRARSAVYDVLSNGTSIDLAINVN
ncbi:MAG: OsmC family protein [Vicinamibacterales bacterium]